ncbi:MAG TPA: hypothetical protein VE153_22220 [Myxococcus sp.]|nr:hypothetical protein [Myxococcus sp.]
MTSACNLFLLRTLEDDVLYLPWQVALLGLLVSRLETWSARDAWLSGLLLGGAWLVHYPALVWAGPLVLACASAGPREQPWYSAGRLKRLGAVRLGGLVVVLAFGGVRWLYGGSWGSCVDLLLLPPNAVVGLRSSMGWMLVRLSSLPAVLVPFWPLQESVRQSLLVYLLRLLVAAVILGWTVVMLVRPLWRKAAPATPRERASTFVLRSLVICTVPSFIMPDGAFYERLSHVPLFTLVLIGLRLAPSTLTAAPATEAALPAPSLAPRRGAWATAALVCASLLWAAWQERGSSWMARYTALRTAHPDACHFVFAESEFVPGSIKEYGRAFALREALPSHQLIRTSNANWKIAPNFITADQARSGHRDCVWYSDASRALLRDSGQPPPLVSSPAEP